jgi:hypothetical protein
MAMAFSGRANSLVFGAELGHLRWNRLFLERGRCRAGLEPARRLGLGWRATDIDTLLDRIGTSQFEGRRGVGSGVHLPECPRVVSEALLQGGLLGRFIYQRADSLRDLAEAANYGVVLRREMQDSSIDLMEFIGDDLVVGCENTEALIQCRIDSVNRRFHSVHVGTDCHGIIADLG